MRRLLNEDRRRSSGESQKLFDVQTLFGQVLISSTFFARVFRTNVILAAFSSYILALAKICTKNARI